MSVKNLVQRSQSIFSTLFSLKRQNELIHCLWFKLLYLLCCLISSKIVANILWNKFDVYHPAFIPAHIVSGFFCKQTFPGHYDFETLCLDFICITVCVHVKKYKETWKRSRRLNFPQFSLLRQWASNSCLYSNIYGLRSVSLSSNSCRNTNLPQPLHKSPKIARHLKATNLAGLRSCRATGGAECCTWMPVMSSITPHERGFLFLSVCACHQL